MSSRNMTCRPLPRYPTRWTAHVGRTTFLRLFLLLLFPSPILAQSVRLPAIPCPINIFEFASEQADRPLKEALQTAIMDRLRGSQCTLSFVPRSLLERMASVESYLEREKVRYVIEGHLTSLPGEKLEIVVTVTDRAATASDRLKPSLRKVHKKNLTTWDHQFARLADDVAPFITGEIKKPKVLTYCFMPLALNDKDLSILGLELTSELTTALEGTALARTYELVGVPSMRLHLECDQPNSGLLSEELDLFDYVIGGNITKRGHTISLRIGVTYPQTKNPEDQLPAFRLPVSDYAGSALAVASFICMHWPHPPSATMACTPSRSNGPP